MIRFIPTSLASLALILIGTLGVPQKSYALVPSNGKWHTIYHVQVKHKSHDSWRSIAQFDSRSSADRHLASQHSSFHAVRVFEDRVFRSTPITNVHQNQHSFQSRWFQSPFLFNQHHNVHHNQHHNVHHNQHHNVHHNQQHQQQQFSSHQSSQRQNHSTSSSKKK